MHKKNLIVAAVGDNSLHRTWIPHKNHDLYLLHYGDRNVFSNDAQVYHKRKGTKYEMIDWILDQNPEIMDYDYVWFPDDDIYLSPSDIDMMFNIARNNDLWICQPSIMGYYGLEVTLHHAATHLRYTNYVEIMCPCFSTSVLDKCRPSFLENKTGWGIDCLWNVWLGHPTNRLAIIDDVIAVHTRPVGGGDMYNNQAGGQLDNAIKEAAVVWQKYNMGKESYKDLCRGRLISQEVFGDLYYNTVEYSSVYRSQEAGIPSGKRAWPLSDVTKSLCADIRSKYST